MRLSVVWRVVLLLRMVLLLPHHLTVLCIITTMESTTAVHGGLRSLHLLTRLALCKAISGS